MKNRTRPPGSSYAYNKARTQAIRIFIIGLKSMPCTDCGFVYDAVCMDFDHRPGTVKNVEIARLARSGCSLERLKPIAKCDLVCANCHRLRTKERGRVEKRLRKPVQQLSLIPEAA